MTSAISGEGEKPRLNSIGKYQIIGTLGRGSMGVVYKARDPEIGRVVAIKTLRKISAGHFHDADEALTRFRIEARAAGNLRHPNIITIFDVNIQDDVPYIVMDYVEGESLDGILAKYSRLRKDLVLYYLKQIAGGLDAAHAKGVIHRDVKPSNIIVDRSDNCYIADFGVASFNQSLSESEQEAKSRSEPVMGTPAYMSPEQILNKSVDHRADLFSLGVLAFECFAGQRPFPGTNFTEVLGNILGAKPLSLTALADLPLALEAEFEKALAKKPEERFASAEAMVQGFARALGVERIDKPTLSAVPGEERGAAKTGSDGEWKAVGGPALEAAPQAEQAKSSLEELKKVPNVPLEASVEKTSSSGEYVRGDWDQPRHLMDPSMMPVPGDMFAHVDQSLSETIAVRRRSLMVPLFTGLLLLVSVLLGFQVMRVLNEEEPKPRVVSAKKPAAAAAAPVRPVQDEDSALDEPLELRLDPPPMGKLVTEMNDRELLSVLVAPNTEEKEIINALLEAKHRNIPELVAGAKTLLLHDSYNVRVETIKALRDLRDKRSVPLLVEALNDHDPAVRGTAANALGALGSRKALGYLSASYSREDVPEVKIALKMAMEKINGYPLDK